MGYLYLVKITKDDDRYLVVDGRNDALIILGDRATIESTDYAISGLYKNCFDVADEKGSSDSRMFWEDSTYISFNSNAVFRDSLEGFVDTLNEHCQVTEESSQFIISERDISAFGGISYASLIVGARAQGITDAEISHFIAMANKRFSVKRAWFSNIEGIAVFNAAKRFSDDNGDIIGWAALFSLVFSGETGALSSIAGKQNGKFLSLLFSEYKHFGWESLYSLIVSLIVSMANSSKDSPTGYAKFSSFCDLVVEDGYEMSDILALLNSGYSHYSDIRLLLKNGIDSSLAGSLR